MSAVGPRPGIGMLERGGESAVSLLDMEAEAGVGLAPTIPGRYHCMGQEGLIQDQSLISDLFSSILVGPWFSSTKPTVFEYSLQNTMVPSEEPTEPTVVTGEMYIRCTWEDETGRHQLDNATLKAHLSDQLREQIHGYKAAHPTSSVDPSILDGVLNLETYPYYDFAAIHHLIIEALARALREGKVPEDLHRILVEMSTRYINIKVALQKAHQAISFVGSLSTGTAAYNPIDAVGPSPLSTVVASSAFLLGGDSRGVESRGADFGPPRVYTGDSAEWRDGVFDPALLLTSEPDSTSAATPVARRHESPVRAATGGAAAVATRDPRLEFVPVASNAFRVAMFGRAFDIVFPKALTFLDMQARAVQHELVTREALRGVPQQIVEEALREAELIGDHELTVSQIATMNQSAIVQLLQQLLEEFLFEDMQEALTTGKIVLTLQFQLHPANIRVPVSQMHFRHYAIMGHDAVDQPSSAVFDTGVAQPPYLNEYRLRRMFSPSGYEAFVDNMRDVGSIADTGSAFSARVRAEQIAYDSAIARARREAHEDLVDAMTHAGYAREDITPREGKYKAFKQLLEALRGYVGNNEVLITFPRTREVRE